MKLSDMELTKLSSKGQVVIPSEIRKKLNVDKGTVFAVTTNRGMIVLKKLETSMKKEDLETLKLIEEAWDEIERGEYESAPVEEFLKELETW